MSSERLTITVERPTLELTIGAAPSGVGTDLTAIEALTGTGVLERFGEGNWSLGGPYEPFAYPLFWLGEAAAAFESVGVVYRGSADPLGPGAWTFAATLPVGVGGTGAADAGTARANLGLIIGTNVQAFDAGLASLVTVDTAANLLPYTTAANVWSATSLSAFSRTVLDDADAATWRATLGLVIGTDVQARTAILDAISALGSNGLITRTAAGTVAARTLTAPAAGITVSNGSGAGGNPTLVLANDLAAIEGLGSTGIARRTAVDTWTVGTLITYAEVQNVSATDRLLGRSTAGAGSIEEIVCTAAGRALIDDADATAQRVTLGFSDPLVNGQIVALAADQNEATGVMVDATGLAFTPVANAVYFVEFYGIFSTTLTTNGLQWQFVEPTGCNYSGGIFGSVNSASANVFRVGQTSNPVLGVAAQATTSQPVYGWALFETGGSPSGNFKVQIRSELAAGESITLQAGSFIRYRRIS